MSNRLPTSKYMVDEKLNNRIISVNNKAKFSIMHLNSRSLLGNFDKFKLLLGNLQKPFSVIGLSERG